MPGQRQCKVLQSRPALTDDLIRLSITMRQEDIDEVIAGSGVNQYVALQKGMALSKPNACTVINEGGFPIGMFGAIPSAQGGAGVWMLGSDHLIHNVRRFYESSKLWIEKLVKEYGILGCIVDARNQSHIRWLEHLGFAIYKVWEKFGAAQIKFIEYHRSI